MSDFYIYSSRYEKTNSHHEKVPCSVTVIFCGGPTINDINIQSEIKDFYDSNYQTDEIFVIGGEYDKARLKEVFTNNYLETFKYIPKLESQHLSDSISILNFDKNGKLSYSKVCKQGQADLKVLKYLINDGLIKIFIKRGGLIEAKGDAHHFVFPSGKHCNKFLRTGNILMNSAEIFFIAFCLLSRFKENEHKKIFCDTSSINTLAFALLELKKRLVNFNSIPIESFSSYDGLFSKKVRFFGNSLILISSSTSCNIIDRINEHDNDVDTLNIVVLFFLGLKKDFKKRQSNIICNLTKDEIDNPGGIQYYDTYIERECIHCKTGSYPVEVKGDVFLLEKPKINRITLNVTDAPKKLSEFVRQFKSQKENDDNVLKVNYKENKDPTKKYEVYFDMYHVLDTIDKSMRPQLYEKYKEKLFDYINQYIPSNAKYLIPLPDEGSEKLAVIIIKHIAQNYTPSRLPEIVKFDDVLKKMTDQSVVGAAVIVGSCISNGKNLLYLSRTLRPFNKLKLLYFIGLARTSNKEDLEFLKSNLRQGNYGKETNSFVEVESFFCNKDSKDTTWISEKKFLTDYMLDLVDKHNLKDAKVQFQARINLINDSLSLKVKGLANSIFYNNTENGRLRLRKGFAFINFDNYIEDISQADVYFSMSSVVNNLRNEVNYEHCLKHSEYVRNVLDPFNFNRFNDGIIQACILRCARQSELSYHISYDLSNDMKLILEKIIEKHSAQQGEGLIEFLYALAIKRLTLKREHISQLSVMIDAIQGNELVTAFNFYIKENILIDKPTLQEQIESLEKQIELLKAV